MLEICSCTFFCPNKKIHAQTLKHLKALAGSPRHITRESDSDLLSRLGVPKDVLKRSLQRRWEQLSQAGWRSAAGAGAESEPSWRGVSPNPEPTPAPAVKP